MAEKDLKKDLMNKLDSIQNTVFRIEKEQNDERHFHIDTEVQHSLIWGAVIIVIGLIIVWIVKLTH